MRIEEYTAQDEIAHYGTCCTRRLAIGAWERMEG